MDVDVSKLSKPVELKSKRERAIVYMIEFEAFESLFNLYDSVVKDLTVRLLRMVVADGYDLNDVFEDVADMINVLTKYLSDFNKSCDKYVDKYNGTLGYMQMLAYISVFSKVISEFRKIMAEEYKRSLDYLRSDSVDDNKDVV